MWVKVIEQFVSELQTSTFKLAAHRSLLSPAGSFCGFCVLPGGQYALLWSGQSIFTTCKFPYDSAVCSWLRFPLMFQWFYTSHPLLGWWCHLFPTLLLLLLLLQMKSGFLFPDQFNDSFFKIPKWNIHALLISYTSLVWQLKSFMSLL